MGVYSAFNAGIFAWKRLDAVMGSYQNTAVLFDIMGKRIASFVPSEKVNFEGAADKITFLSRVENEGRYDLEKVSFYFDRERNVLMQSEEPIKSVLETDENKKEITVQELSGKMNAVEFKYFCKKPGPETGYEWVDSFDPEKPEACRGVNIFLSSGFDLNKTVYLYVEAKGAPNK